MPTHSELALCATAAVIGLAGTRHNLVQSNQPAATAATGLEKVVLTGRWREERAQTIPLAVTLLTFGAYADKEAEGAVNIPTLLPRPVRRRQERRIGQGHAPWCHRT